MSPIKSYEAYIQVARALDKGDMKNASLLVEIISNAVSKKIKSKSSNDDDFLILTRRQAKKYKRYVK